MKTKSGIVHIMGGCYDCEKQFTAKNATGLAAQHTKKYGHHTWVEIGTHVSFSPSTVKSEEA